MEISPKSIYGNWARGWTLDRHTLSSRSGGGERSKFDRFATERSELGEALFRLKYQGDRGRSRRWPQRSLPLSALKPNFPISGQF